MGNVNAFRKKVIGKPCEGKLHARFDEGEQETGRLSATALALYSTVEKYTIFIVLMVVAGFSPRHINSIFHIYASL